MYEHASTYVSPGGGGHFLCRAVRDARLHMGYF